MLLRNFLEDTCFHHCVSRARAVIEHFIHLLERLAVRFGHAEPCPETAEQAEDCEEDVRAEACLLDKRWRDKADDEVPEPVVAGRYSDTLCAQ